MEITITRVDGAVGVSHAPDYLTNYLQYSHRSFGFKNFRKVNVFEKKELFSIVPGEGLITFAGFFHKIQDLIERNGDTAIVLDQRSTVPDPDIAAINGINWESIGGTGLRDYQIDPVVE